VDISQNFDMVVNFIKKLRENGDQVSLVSKQLNKLVLSLQKLFVMKKLVRIGKVGREARNKIN